jgi:hypothetical protein
MSLRETFLDNFAGDLEYHPRRAVLYIFLAAASASFWYFVSANSQYATLSIVFGLGAITLFVKGIFLFRKSSEGLGMSESELSALSTSKPLPSLPAQAAQMLQDFGAGSLLALPILHTIEGAQDSQSRFPVFFVSCIGAVLFGLGWLIRRLTTPPQTSG